MPGQANRLEVTFTASSARDDEIGHWELTRSQGDARRLDALARAPFQLDRAHGRLGLFQVDTHQKIATLQAQLGKPLTVVGADSDERPKICCVVTLDGLGRMSYRDQPAAQRLSGGEFHFIQPGWPELTLAFEGARRADVVAFIFDPDIPFTQAPDPRRPLRPGGAIGASLSRAAHEVLTCPYTGSAQQLFLEAKLLEVRAALSQELAPPGGRERLACERAREMLLDNLESPPRLADVARELGMSMPRLKAALKRRYGRSFSELLLEERLERARTLLEAGELRVEEVAWRCGYAHVANFSRAFKRRFGTAPSAWLRRTPGG